MDLQKHIWDFWANCSVSCTRLWRWEIFDFINRLGTSKYLWKRPSNVRTMSIFNPYQPLNMDNVNPFARESTPFLKFRVMAAGSGIIHHTMNACKSKHFRSRSMVQGLTTTTHECYIHVNEPTQTRFHTCVVLMNMSLTIGMSKVGNRFPQIISQLKYPGADPSYSGHNTSNRQSSQNEKKSMHGEKIIIRLSCRLSLRNRQPSNFE